VPSKINLITPPDTIHNNNFSFVMINTTPAEQEKTSYFLAKEGDNKEINVFVYNNESNPTWLLNHVNGKHHTYINVDNCLDISVKYISYMMSQSNVYWSTNDNNSKELFGLINTNFIDNIDTFLKRVYPNEQQDNN